MGKTKSTADERNPAPNRDLRVTPVCRAYISALRDERSGIDAEVATIAVDAIGDEQLAGMLRKGNLCKFADSFGDVIGARVRVVDSEANLRALLAVVLQSTTIEGVFDRQDEWQRPEPAMDVTLAGELLNTKVLVEQSDPRLISAIEAAAIAAGGTIGAETIHAGTVIIAQLAESGQMIMAAGGEVGLVAFGVGAAVAVFHLFRRPFLRRPARQ